MGSEELPAEVKESFINYSSFDWGFYSGLSIRNEVQTYVIPAINGGAF
jgi:hypothetical protein